MTATMATSIASPVSLRPANQQAQLLTGRPYISFSQISSMRSCPKRFQLHYIDNVSADFLPASLVYGSAIHAAVETCFHAMMAGLHPSAGDLLHAYRLSWQEQKSAAGNDLSIRYAKDQDESVLGEMADRMITTFLASPASQPQGTLLGVEEQFTVMLDRGLPDVLARVDLVYETDSAIVVRDFKTSRAKWSDQKAEESADQLFLYGRVLREMSRSMSKPVQGEFVVLTKQKTPQLQILSVSITGEGILRTQDAIATTWQAVLAGNYYPNPSPMNCTTCQYKSRCPAFRSH